MSINIRMQAMTALHAISHHDGLRYRGLHLVDLSLGEYISESWKITGSDPCDLVGGFLYFHDSSRSRATFAARIIEVIDLTDVGKAGYVAFRIRRQRSAGQPWRGHTASQSVPHGGMVPATFENDGYASAA